MVGKWFSVPFLRNECVNFDQLVQLYCLDKDKN